jgi:5-methylcytosine-specific restriction enzyme A
MVTTMPMRAPKVCGCGVAIASGQQCACQRARKANADRRRPNAVQRGYDARWRRESRIFLAQPENRRCCCGCNRVADTVDHHIPHRGDMVLFWDTTNWRPYAFGCHSSKAQKKDHAIENKVGGAPEFRTRGAVTGPGVEMLVVRNKIPGN